MTKGISSYFFSVPVSMLARSLKNIPGQVTATWDTTGERIQNCYFVIQQNEGKTDHGRQRLKYVLGKDAEEEATEQEQQYDNEQCVIVSKMKLLSQEIHLKEFRVLHIKQFEWYQHKDYYGQLHTTHWDGDKSNKSIQIRSPSNC